VKNGWEPPENGVFGVQKIPNLDFKSLASGEAFRETLGLYKKICWDHINGCGSVLWTPRVSGTTVAG